MQGYTSSDVARMLDLSVGQVRTYARAGFFDPARGSRGEDRFSFQDLVLLRTAKGLTARIPARRVCTALRRLRQQLPTGRPLSGVQIGADGDSIVAHQSGRIWQPESGQTHFNFQGEDQQPAAVPDAVPVPALRRDNTLDPEDWFRLANDLEMSAPEQAREAYRRALELDPGHVDARINLGRLLHEAGQLRAAEANYRLSLADQPDDATALFNLGVVVEDDGRRREATEIYRRTIAADPEYADAYFNLARLLEQLGDRTAALRYLSTYRKLTEEC